MGESREKIAVGKYGDEKQKRERFWGLSRFNHVEKLLL